MPARALTVPAVKLIEDASRPGSGYPTTTTLSPNLSRGSERNCRTLRVGLDRMTATSFFSSRPSRSLKLGFDSRLGYNHAHHGDSSRHRRLRPGRNHGAVFCGCEEPERVR